MTVRLGPKAAAAHCGIAWSTWRAHQTRGTGPKPDGYDEEFGHKYWHDTTLNEWLAGRPGSGNRTPRKK